MIVFNHNTMANAVFSNNNMANFYNNFVKAFDTTTEPHKAELCIEPFNCRGNCYNAFNGMTFSTGDSHSDIHIDTLDLSEVTWAQNMYKHVSGYDGANIYINTLIFNLDKIKPTSGTSRYGIDNMFGGMTSMHVNEVKILGNFYNCQYYSSSNNAFNGMHVDHFYTGTEINSSSSTLRQYLAKDCKDWRYCVSDTTRPIGWGASTFYCRDHDTHPIPLETHRMGVGYIANDFSSNNQSIHDFVGDGSTSPTTFTFSEKLYSVYNTNRFCTTDLWKYSITTACDSDHFKNSKGGFFNICPACIFDNYDDWNSPEGVAIRETAIPTSITTLDNAYNAVISLTPTRKIPLGYCGMDFAPICGPAVTSMQNAYRNCQGIFSMSAVCGPNVTNMQYAYADCSNLKTAACGTNVKDMSYAYKGCTNLTTAACGPNVTNMRSAYHDCTSIEEAVCGENVEIMDNAYRGCTSVKTAAVGPNVFTMNYAYAGCTSLTTACDGICVGFMENAYLGCTSLTKFVSRLSERKDSWWDMWGTKWGIPKELWDTMEYEYIPPTDVP